MDLAVIFDLDGTLVDSEPNYFEAERRLLAECGIEGFDEQEKLRYVGVSTKEMMEDLVSRYGLTESVPALAARKNGYYLELARAGTPVYPAMRELLELLRGAGSPMAVASGSSPEVIEVVLTMTGLRPYFDVVVSADSVPRGKPSPDLFLETARRLDVPASRCVVVEDARHGVAAAHHAGMACVAVPYLTDEPLAAEFDTAELLFPAGMAEFTAEAAFEWMRERSVRGA